MKNLVQFINWGCIHNSISCMGGQKQWWIVLANGLNDKPINRLTYGDVQVTKKNSNNLQEKYIKSAKNTSWNLADVGNLLTLINEKYSFSIIISIFIVINSVKQVTNTSHPLNILLHYLQVARLEVADILKMEI